MMQIRLIAEPPPSPPILGGSEIQSPPELGDLGGLMCNDFKWIWYKPSFVTAAKVNFETLV
jgi:hypothetical protein